ncbi:MAG: alpha/beta fold hydrolase [Motilibacteraceae bacterium]
MPAVPEVPVDASAVLEPGPWEHRMVAANGARFHVAELGEGPLVVLLHGFPGDWWAWRHQLVALADAGYRAAALDLRGYGGSDKPPRGYDLPTLAGDVAGVVRSLGARDAAVVGHDWGGAVAWTLAALQPGVVRRVGVVSSPHPRRMRTALLTSRTQLLASRHILGFQRPMLPERQLVADDGALVERMLRAWSATGWPDPESARHYRTSIQVPGTAHCSMEGWRWAVRSVPRGDGIRYHRAMKTPITVPVLQLHGALDRALLPGSAQGSSHYVDGPYRWQLLPGVGHFPHEEDPEAVSGQLLRWLGEDGR